MNVVSLEADLVGVPWNWIWTTGSRRGMGPVLSSDMATFSCMQWNCPLHLWTHSWTLPWLFASSPPPSPRLPLLRSLFRPPRFHSLVRFLLQTFTCSSQFFSCTSPGRDGRNFPQEDENGGPPDTEEVDRQGTEPRPDQDVEERVREGWARLHYPRCWGGRRRRQREPESSCALLSLSEWSAPAPPLHWSLPLFLPRTLPQGYLSTCLSVFILAAVFSCFWVFQLSPVSANSATQISSIG